MAVGTLLTCLILFQSDPKDRLLDAVRETRIAETQQALADLAQGDGARAARAVIAALPKARERLHVLVSATVRARENYENVDTSFGFNIKEEVSKQRQLELAAARVRETVIQALEGEKVYESVLDIRGFLKPEAVPVFASEIERSSQWLLKCELLEGLGAMGSKEAKDALSAAVDREGGVFLATALASGSDDRAVAYLAHPQWQVRVAAIDALRKSRGAVGPLIDGLSSNDLRYRKEACAALREITKTELPTDPEAWRDWWKANREDFQIGAYSPSSKRVLPGPGRTTVFYDIPVQSSRVCFVIDRSRSMREQGRFDDAKKELKRLLESLPDGSLVNILFFGGSTACFAKSPRALEAQTRRQMTEYVDRMGLEHGTDLYAALEKALTMVGNPDSGRLHDDGVDTIVVLSDGQATVGRIVDDDLIARIIARRARYLKPVFHAVSLSSDARALRLLAERTVGEYRAK